MDELLDAYSGEKAVGYDERRAKSARWKAEIAAMEVMLAKAGATRVLDCPFGTGRWVPQYLAQKLSVIGIDLSAGMLAEAQAKIDALDPKTQEMFTLREASIFDLDPTVEAANPPDLIVCIRFLNWINFADVEKAIDLLTRYETPQMIIGASVVPKQINALRRWWYKATLGLINARQSKGRQQYVHDEAALLALLKRHGWQVSLRHRIMRRHARANYFYHLTRA